MKKKIFVIRVIIISLYSFCTVNSTTLPEYNKLRTPVSPAFTILDISPTQVERPNTPASLAATLLNSTHDITRIPGNFSLEFSPFWLTHHPYLTWRDEAKKDPFNEIFRTFAISLATTPLDSTTKRRTGIALGFRTNILSGDFDITHAKKIDSGLHEISLLLVNSRNAAITALINQRNIEIAKEPTTDGKNKILEEYANKELFVMRHYDSLYASVLIPKMNTSTANEVSYRTGTFWDLGSAVAVKVRDSTLDSAKLFRTGIWSTLSYNGTNFSGVIVGRWYGAPDTSDIFRSIYDVGGRIIYAVNRFAFSVEGVFRGFSKVNNIAPLNQYRLSIMGEYKISDHFWISGILAKNYSSVPNRNLIGQLGISFNHSSEDEIAQQSLNKNND